MSEALISGAQFQLTYANGGYVDNDNGHLSTNGIYTTDDKGEIRVSGIVGTIVAKEIQAAPGYTIDQATQTQTVTVNPMDTQTLVFLNEPLCSLTLTKLDSVTGKPVPNTTFTVKDGSGNVLGRYTTGKDGTVTVTGLIPNSTVVVTETNVPEGYVLDSTPKTITVKNGTDNSVTTGGTGNDLTFENDPKMTLTIHKYIEGTANEPLAGVAFKVTDGSGAAVGTGDGVYYTNKEGEIKVTGIEPGTTLTVRETKTVEGFVLDGTPKTVQVKAGQPAPELTFWNKRDCTLTILKQSTSKEPLPGAVFHVTDEDGAAIGTNNGRHTSDRNGLITITGLQPGQVLVVTEEKAPDGYIRDMTPKTIKIKQDVANSLIFENAHAGSLVINKRSSVDKKTPLEGVTFKITTTSGEFLPDENGKISSNGLYYTDDNGQIVLNSVVGTLVVTEVASIDGYIISDANRTQTVEVKPDDTQTLYFYNDPLCSLTITKLDSVTGKPVPNTQFTVKDGNGNVLATCTTGTDGTATVTGLVPNSTVVVVETRVPSGYVLNSTPQTIIVRNGGNTVTNSTTSSSSAVTAVPNGSTDNGLIFENEPTQTLTIHKYIEGTQNEPLAGVTFKLVDGSGAAVGSGDGVFYTDKAGEIVVDGIEPGTTVIAREIKTVEGFVLDGTPKTVKITASQKSPELVFWNQRAGTLVIQKKDKVSGALISGAQFQLTYANGGYVDNDNGHLSSNGLYTTDDTGEIRINGIIGTVVAKEVKAAPGYVIDSATQTQTVTVNPLDTQTLVFLNEPLCSLTITKLDSVTGKPVPNTQFAVKDGSGNVLATCATGSDGTATVTGLMPNSTVVVVETKVPSGYVLNSTPQTIIVRNGGNTVTNSTTSSSSTVTTTPSGTSVTNTDGNGLTFENDPTMTLTIHKYIEGTQNEPLAGVAFKLVDGSGTPVGPSDGTYYTDSKGEIVVEGLEPGTTITAREIKTVDGFVLDGTPKSVKIKAGEGAPELTFWNKRAGELVIRKLDSVTKQPLAGVEFELTYAGGGYVDNADGHLSSNGLYTTDSHGEIHISGVTGTIVVKETRTIDGYTIDESTRIQTVKVNAQDTQTLTFYNAPKQTLTIQKYVDGTTDPIQGVTFLVTDSSGAVLGPNNGEFITDKNGRIVITDLTPGTTITAKETKTAAGYVLDTTPQSILIKQGVAQTLTFFNKIEGGLELIKVSESDSTQRISGVTFEIRKKDGGLIDTVTTGKDGRVHVNLEAGDYYAVETECPKEFKLDDTPHYFTVKDGKTTTLTVKNKPFSGILIHKTDSVTGKGIYGVTFLLYDSKNTPIGQYTSDNSGYVYIEGLTDGGRYYLRELENEGYVPDNQMKTVYVKAGETTLIEWKNTPITGQIQITKTSADYNSMNGWPAGTPIPGTEFEIYHYRTGNLVDTVRTDKNGVAVSRPLPLGRYKIVESKAADFYGLDKTPIEAELEHTGQIVKVAMTNKALSTNVSIKKTGYAEVMPGQGIRYTFSEIGNNSTTALTSFYWRDTLPVNAVRLYKIFTGTYNAPGNYKVVYKTNLSNGEYRTMYDNLSTAKNYTLDASPVALGLGSNEYVTEFMFVFGVVPANFRQVEAPKVDCKVLATVKGGSQFTNTADVGGVYNGQWIQAVTRWTTKVYGKPIIPTLPKTGY